MIDVASEALLSPAQATRHPAFRNAYGRPSHAATLYRMIQRGTLDPNGHRVKLEAVRTPRGLRTSEAAILRFVEALNPDADPAGGEVRPSRKGGDAAAAGQLAAAGF